MKWLLVLSLFSFVGCQVKSGGKGFHYNAEPVKVPKIEIPKAPMVIESKTLEPKISVNENLKEIEILNDAGNFCGVELNQGEIIPYQFSTNDLLQLDLNKKTIFLVRENSNGNPSPEAVMFGKWVSVMNGDEGLANMNIEINSADKITVNITCTRKS
jgi:hypothetical protein